MSKPIAYGIDFGTTNSLISAAYPDRVDLLVAEGRGALLPSIVYLNRDGVSLAGDTAVQTYSAAASYKTSCGDCDLAYFDGRDFQSDCRFARQGHGCRDARLIGEIKRFLADEDLEHTHSWGVNYRFSDIAAVIIGQLKARADAVTGGGVNRAVIGHPVAFAGSEGRGFARRQKLGLSRLMEAAHAAGFHEVELLEEPAAAVSMEDSTGLVAALDFGGGTFDVVIIDMKADRGEVVAMQGVAVGGEDFDEELFRAKLWDVFDLDSPEVPQQLGERVARRSGAVRALGDGGVAPMLGTATAGSKLLADVLYGGHAYGLFQAIEDAKIALSGSSKARIKFDRPGIRIDVPVSRPEFEKLISPHLDLVTAQMDRALEQAGVRAGDIDLVVRTGGSSSIPTFVDRLQDRFHADRIVQRAPHETIAVGLGLHARKVWS